MRGARIAACVLTGPLLVAQMTRWVGRLEMGDIGALVVGWLLLQISYKASAVSRHKRPGCIRAALGFVALQYEASCITCHSRIRIQKLAHDQVKANYRVDHRSIAGGLATVAADSLYFEKGRPSRPRNTEECAVNRGKSSSRSRYRPFSRVIHLVIGSTESLPVWALQTGFL